ncbi:MAG TPA: beta-propeller fold lactonase family protein, partial [Proteiniphilum sp.]|nr:beta-propeller fold lactonase family protein [Proteiniphilum sp.]
MTIVTLVASLFISCNGKRADARKSNDQLAAADSSAVVSHDMLYLAVGTYTSEEGSRGIYLYHFDALTGKSDSVSMAEVTNPSYLAFSPDEQVLYAVGENGEQGAVHAFSFDKAKGTLKKINTQETKGSGPCYVTIDAKGRNVHTANYGGGSISSFQVNDDGSLSPLLSLIQFSGSGPDSSRQRQPHLHSVAYSPDGLSLFATDLGSDKLYRFNVQDTPFRGQPVIQESNMTAIETPAGTGPRHFAFHPDGGRYLYLLGELSGEVEVYDHHNGELTE